MRMCQPRLSWILTLLVVFGMATPVCADIQYRYFYDNLNRLTKVTDSSGVVLEYVYDQVGNILDVKRSGLANFVLLDFSPKAGGIGSRVVLDGQGFSAELSENAVSFNGVMAPVVSATPTRLEVEVPVGTSTGPISITIGTETIVSTTSFLVQVIPVITSIAPRLILSDSPIPAMTVVGANLAGATFNFTPAFVPPSVSVTSATVAGDGNSATLGVGVTSDAVGTFTLVASNTTSQSSGFGSGGNTITVLGPASNDLDGDGLTNAEELALGTDPTSADSDGDGMPDLFEIQKGFDPNDPSDALLDADNDGITNVDEFQQGTDPLNPDLTPPGVAQVFPADGQTALATNANITVRFTEPLTPDSLLLSSVRLFQGALAVAGQIQLSDDQLSITFKPTESLSAFALHTVQVQGVRDVAGNPMVGVFESTFTTGELTDIIPPTVLRTSPANSQAAVVPVNAPYTIEFSEPMDPASLTPTTFIVSSQTMEAGQGSRRVAGMIQVDPDGRRVSFIPDQPFPVGRLHFVILNPAPPDPCEDFPGDPEDCFCEDFPVDPEVCPFGDPEPTPMITDAAGNILGSQAFLFKTVFTQDSDPPTLVGASPADVATNVPINALIVLQFNEPLNPVNFLGGIEVSVGGQPVPGSMALSDGNRRVTFTSSAAFATNMLHTVTLTTQITDLVGHPLDNPGSFMFTTSAVVDLTSPTVTQVDPADGATGVPTNVVAQVMFSEPMNPFTVTPSNFFIEDGITGIDMVGAVAVATDRLSATFTPDTPLTPFTNYRVRVVSGPADLAGNGKVLGGVVANVITSDFTTGAGEDTVVPSVSGVSPPDGSLGAPVNTQVMVQVSEPLQAIGLGSTAVQLSTVAGAVPGTVTLSSDRRSLTFLPTNPLVVNTAHTINVAGCVDLAGNALVPFSSSFTTAVGNVADTTMPSVITVSPINGATAVPVIMPITVTFNEVVDPTTVTSSSMPITIDGVSGQVAGSYAVNGAVVTFMPTDPFPAAVRVRVEVLFNGAGVRVRDLAGNKSVFFQSTFDTASDVTDTTAPTVAMITPVDGATEIGLTTQVVMTFSEALNPATITDTTFALLANGSQLDTTVTRSADNRTVTLSLPSSPFPAASVVAVAVTSGVEDLSGNALADFSSQFTTAAAVGFPRVVTARPGNGVFGVNPSTSVILYTSASLDAATLPGALFISQNGVVKSGSTTLTGNGQILEFVPDVPFEFGAFIQVFLTPASRDVAGNALTNYQGFFRTVSNDPSSNGPSVLQSSPTGFATDVARNVVVEVELTETLDPATVDATTVSLEENIGGTTTVVPSTVSVVRDGRVIRIVPDVPLAAGTSHTWLISSGVQDLDGQGLCCTAPPFFHVGSFTTGGNEDTSAPTVVAVTPQDGAVEVGINATIRVKFDERINPLTVTGTTILVMDSSQAVVPCTINFSNSNQDLEIVPHAPLPDASALTITVDGVEDFAGNVVAAQTTAFMTRTGPDTTAPTVVATTPFSDATDVPVNSVVTLDVDEPIDTATVNATSFFVRDPTTFQAVPGNFSVSAGGRQVSFIPTAPWVGGRVYTVFFQNRGILDFVGERLGGADFAFTIGFATDTTAPQVMGVSPADGSTVVPTNTRVVIALDEPVQSLSVDQVTLSAGGSEVAVLRGLSDGNRTLTLTPLVPLNPLTLHTVQIDGLQDLAGNILATMVTTSFTTGSGVDLISPTGTQVFPVGGATGVPTNVAAQVTFSERVNPFTVTPSTFFIGGGSAIVGVGGNVVVAADGLSAIYTPDVPLTPSTIYRVRVTPSVTDLAGNPVANFASNFTTAP